MVLKTNSLLTIFCASIKSAFSKCIIQNPYCDLGEYEKPSSPLHKMQSPCLYGFNNTTTIQNFSARKRGGILCHL